MPAVTPTLQLDDAQLMAQYLRWEQLGQEGDTEAIDANQVRHWLAHMPARLSAVTLAGWGETLSNLAWVTIEDEGASPDGHLLVAFLEYAVKVPLHVWLAEDENWVAPTVPYEDYENGYEEPPHARSAYDGFLRALRMLSFSSGAGPHPMLMAALHLGWEPTSLLDHLDGAREIQRLYCEENAHHRSEAPPTSLTAQAFLLEGILGAMATSTWRPNNRTHPVWEGLWNSHVHGYYQETEAIGELALHGAEQRRAAEAALVAFPHFKGQAMQAYLDWRQLRVKLIAHRFFPLSAQHDNGLAVLVPLLSAWLKKDGTNPGATALCNQLVQQHPAVAQLLEMHCSFYTQPNHALRDAPSLLDAYQSALGLDQDTPLSIAHLDLG